MHPPFVSCWSSRLTQIYSFYYFAVLCLSLRNCIMTKEEREEQAELDEERKTMKEFEEFVLQSPGLPRTASLRQPGPVPGKAPFHHMAPRSNGASSSDLPLRQHFSTPNPRRSMHQESAETLSGHRAQSQTSFVQTSAV